MAIISTKPLGIRLLQFLFKRKFSFEFYQASVLILTFIAYALYHLSRKPASIVKSTLISTGWPTISQNSTPLGLIANVSMDQAMGNLTALKGWAPFDGGSGRELLADIDVAFLATYAVGTFFAGRLGDRVCLRWVLTVGMIGSGMLSCFYGIAYWWKIHWLPYFFIVQILAGVFQATGWPSVVSVMGNWYGKKKRGLIMGVWNAHTSIGNIGGSLIASSLLVKGWGWAFIVPGLIIIAGGLLVFLFLVVDPSVVGFLSPHAHIDGDAEKGSYDEEASVKGSPSKAAPNVCAKLQETHDGEEGLDSKGLQGKLAEEESLAVSLLENVHPVGFREALSIPGVVPFALCLFFAKLVAYTFNYWLPFYITETEIGGKYISDEAAGNISTFFDVGGVVGGIVAGHTSDKLKSRATIAILFTWGAVPSMALYRVLGGYSLLVNVILLMVSGFFVNGPYALITTAVSADLGIHERVRGNARALATVTAIIDGTGSLGAALGPLCTGYITQLFGWNYVFVMLTASNFISGIFLLKQVALEVKSWSLSS